MAHLPACLQGPLLDDPHNEMSMAEGSVVGGVLESDVAVKCCPVLHYPFVLASAKKIPYKTVAATALADGSYWHLLCWLSDTAGVLVLSINKESCRAALVSQQCWRACGHCCLALNAHSCMHGPPVAACAALCDPSV